MEPTDATAPQIQDSQDGRRAVQRRGTVRVVTVAYNPGEELVRFLESLGRASRRRVRVVIADNGSEHEIVREAAERFGAEVVTDGTNRGYGAGANLAARDLSEDWIVVANPDIVWRPDSLDVLIDAGLNTAGAGCLGPRLLNPDGSVYPYPGERDFEDNVVEEQTGTIALRLRFPNAQSRLLPGSMVRVNIVSSSPTLDIMIPQEAIGSDPQGDYVYVVDAENVAHRRDVVLGADSGAMRQVSSGLREGETVVLRGLQGVRDGMTVSPMTQPAEGAEKNS